jgi:putative heme-binding domain-containing protein
MVAAEDVGPLFNAIKNGIPGTEMVPLGISTDHTWQIVSYLRSLTQPGAQAPVEGDVDEGRQVFEAVGCRNCHMIAGVGGILGPDLSGIARARTSEAIRESVLDPSKVVLPGFKGALIIDQTGRVYTGVVKNEDNFTIQFLTTTLERVSLDRPGLRAVDLKKKSFMPESYGRRLDQAQLQNLLAFLDRQRQPTLHYEKGFANY